jgi:microcystin degradation protein MlrC
MTGHLADTTTVLRIFSAGLDSETNTFTNFPTTLKTFEETGIWRGNAATGSCWLSPVAATWAHLASESGCQYEEGLFAAAQPAGPVVTRVYEGLRDEILNALTARGPFDIVLLHLHGAMVAEGYDDCEGDILQRVKSVQPARSVIGAVLDPHCHLSERMVANADLLIACKHYPHDDYADRAAEVFRLCVRAANGQIKPTPAVFDCKMVGVYPTHEEPMATVVRSLSDAERSPDILSASFIHGMPWGDTLDTGSKVLVYADGDVRRANSCARSLGQAVYELRDQLLPRYPSIDEALDEALRVDGLAVLADTGDNAGGGAPGDNVAILASMLERGITNAAFGSVWDPQVANLCAEAGVGARLTLRLGGKTNVSSGTPLEVRARVCAINPRHEQTSLGETRQPMGLCAWLEIEGIDVVVSTTRSQVFAPNLFTGLGIELLRKHIVVVKSTNHFFSRFSPIAQRVIRVATPGALYMDLAHIDYRKRAPDYHPRVNDPLGCPQSA